MVTSASASTVTGSSMSRGMRNQCRRAQRTVTIATGPLLFKRFWHRHYGKFAFAWCVLTLLPLAAVYGVPAAAAALTHVLLAEYLSFIVLLFALYVVAGGILLTGDLRGTPLVNTKMLAFGTLMASVVGTTGAAMILRP